MLKSFLIISALAATTFLHAQDPFFTQYNSAPLYLNPAFTGSTGHARAAASFRDQWPGISGNYVTTNVSYDQFFKKLHGGVGINLQNDVEGGTFFTNSAGLSYAFHLPLLDNRLVIAPGFSAGVLSRKIDLQSLTFGDMIDPRRGFVYNPTEVPSRTTSTVFDASVGFIAYTKRITAGFSAAHITNPDVGFYGTSRLPTRFTIHASGVIGNVPGEFENKISIVPQVVYTHQADFRQVTAGVSLLFSHYSLGVAYRDMDAAILMLGFQNKLFRASYSYDYTVSGLDNSYTGGSHELSVQFYLFRKMKPEGFLAPASITY